jgi:hypothetical protein
VVFPILLCVKYRDTSLHRWILWTGMEIIATHITIHGWKQSLSLHVTTTTVYIVEKTKEHIPDPSHFYYPTLHCYNSNRKLQPKLEGKWCSQITYCDIHILL